jgi:hypothetical protein
MKTLDEVKSYFENEGYLVRPYSNLAEGQKGIAVHGRAWNTGYMELIVFKSDAIIIFSGETCILRTLYVPYPLDEPFDTLEDLLTVAKEKLGPPTEEVTTS